MVKFVQNSCNQRQTESIDKYKCSLPPSGTTNVVSVPVKPRTTFVENGSCPNLIVSCYGHWREFRQVKSLLKSFEIFILCRVLSFFSETCKLQFLRQTVIEFCREISNKYVCSKLVATRLNDWLGIRWVDFKNIILTASFLDSILSSISECKWKTVHGEDEWTTDCTRCCWENYPPQILDDCRRAGHGARMSSGNSMRMVLYSDSTGTNRRGAQRADGSIRWKTTSVLFFVYGS